MPRLNPYAHLPLLQPLIDCSNAVVASGLEPSLLELVKIRASQINGCAICMHLHTTEARKQGETEQRIFMLSAWRESTLFTPRERAALAWTEALTRLTDTHAPDSDYELVRAAFTEDEQVKLTLMVATINAWNRLGVGFRLAPPTTESRAA